MLRIFTHFAWSVIANAIILYVVSTYIPQLWFVISTDGVVNIYVMFTILWIIFWFFNVLLKSIIKVLAIPFSIITFGLSSVIINIAIIYVFGYVINTANIGAQVTLGTLIQTLLLSVVISIAYFILKKVL
jgi:putative membrane protein